MPAIGFIIILPVIYCPGIKCNLHKQNCFSQTFIHLFFILVLSACNNASHDKEEAQIAFHPRFKIIPVEKFTINNFVDCNMAQAWIGDTFRIFPGKYGEDTVWGNSKDLKFASGKSPDEAFGSDTSKFTEPKLPAIASIGAPGLHGAVWFETIYQDTRDTSGKTLYAVYHNENYPENLPYEPATDEGYKNLN